MAEGHCQHGCHGVVPDNHSVADGVTEQEGIWDNPGAHGVGISLKAPRVINSHSPDIVLYSPSRNDSWNCQRHQFSTVAIQATQSEGYGDSEPHHSE